MSNVLVGEPGPFIARVYPEVDMTSIDTSYIRAVIEPPISINTNSIAVTSRFDMDPSAQINVVEQFTTTTKTLIEIEVKDENVRQSHDARIEIAVEGLRDFLSLVNDVENGTFNGNM